MTRLHVLAAHPRRTIGALAVVLAAVGVTVGSGANFSAHAANPNNTFATGTLSITNTPASALFTLPNMRPGDIEVGEVDIENSGTLAGDFTLSTSAPTGSAVLLSTIDLVVEDCGMYIGPIAPDCTDGDEVERYNGKLNAVGAAGLGNYAAADKHRYRFTVTLPGSAGDALQGTSAAITFDWDAVSS